MVEKVLQPSKFSEFDRIEQHEKIGEGTYALVYNGCAISKSTSTKVAIKKIKPAFTDGLDMSAIREIKYLKELSHPNVIKLLEVINASKLSLVLEFLESDLEMIIKNTNVVFSGADIKSWMLMLLRGLNHIHSNFILHRDLKPNNLLLSDQGILKIADFGLARTFGDPFLPMTSQVVTRWYRAPELLFGSKYYSGSIDIWSVGCIFGELMLRTPYFASETDIGQLKTITKARGTPTEQEWPGMKSLPDYFELEKEEGVPSKLLFTAANPDAVELLDSMLMYDPLKRPAADSCLEYSYFKNLPRPTKPIKLPKIVNEVLNNKRKAQEEFENRAGKIAKKLF